MGALTRVRETLFGSRGQRPPRLQEQRNKVSPSCTRPRWHRAFVHGRRDPRCGGAQDHAAVSIVLVLGGLASSFVPRLPAVNLNPDVVFYFILPALIYPAALFTSWRDFRRNLRPILLLAIGLVLATTLAVAWIAHSIVPALPWAAAFALGAIVSPPDAVAATAIIRRLGVPHRIQVILEGESLVNDATALVALQFAIAALVTGISLRRMLRGGLCGRRQAASELDCLLAWRCAGCRAIWMIRQSKSHFLC